VTKKVQEKLPPQPTIEEAKEKIEQQVQEQGVVSVVEAAVPGQGSHAHPRGKEKPLSKISERSRNRVLARDC
jgi:hypothetical protein